MKCYKNILHKGLRRDPVGGQENNTIRKSLTLLIKLSGECLCNTNFIQKQFGRFTHKKDVKHVVKRSAISRYGTELCAGRVGRAKGVTALARRSVTKVLYLLYQMLLEQPGMKASMSRKGNFYDNALMESFWGTLKKELINYRRYTTL